MSTEINIKKKIAILDEGANVTTDATSIDFVGTGVTTTAVNGDVTVSIPGGLTSAVTSVATTGLISGGTITSTGTISTSMSTNKLVGRYSALTGIMEEVTIGSGLTLTGAGTLNNTATPTPLGYYGAFSDVTDQFATLVNTGYPMLLGVTDLSNGVTVVSGSRVTIANTGIYNIQWSAQFRNPTANIHDVTIWLRKNGVDVPGSSGIVAVTPKHGIFDGHILPSWNFLIDPIAGDYYEFVWSTQNTSVFISFEPAGSPPPSTASVVLTVTQQSGIMAGTGITAINSLTGSAQTLTTGTTGTDFAIVDSGVDHKFNLPTASATNRGALSSANWTTFNNKVDGSGTINKLSKWTGGSTLGDSLFADNGTRANIGGTYIADTILSIQSGLSNLYGINVLSSSNAVVASTISDFSTAIAAYAVRGTGVYGESSNDSFGGNTGVYGKAFQTDLPALATNTGGKFEAYGGAANYSVQLVDGSEASGKFLKSVTATGQANWANITTADVSGSITGSGTNNYLTKWTPTGTALGNSLIQDDGTTLSIGTTPSATVQFLIQSNKSRGLSVTGLSVGVYGDINFTSANGTYHGLYGDSNLVAGSATRITYGVYGITNGGRGVFGISSSNGYDNVGVEGKASSNGFGAPGLNIGGKFTATGATANYGIQIIDGTEGTGKYLKCVDGSTGYANWAAIPVAFSPQDVSSADTAPTAASTQYYYQTISTVTGTISKVKMWGFSGTDLVRFGIYRGTLGGSMTLIGQGSTTGVIGPNEISLTAEVGQTLNLVVGENLVVGYYADGISWRTVYDVGISDALFGISNTANITTMPATPTGTATAIRFACTLYS